MTTSHNALVINGLDVITNTHIFQLVNGAALFYPLPGRTRLNNWTKSIYLSICLSIYLFVCLSSVCMSVCPQSVQLSICLSSIHPMSACLSVLRPFNYLPACLFVLILVCWSSIHPSVCLFSVHPPIYLSVLHLSTYMSVLLFVCPPSIHLSPYLMSLGIGVNMAFFSYSNTAVNEASLQRSVCGGGHLNESVSCTIISDGQAKGVLCFSDLHLFGFSSDVSEDEVLKADLPPQQLLHVHFV